MLFLPYYLHTESLDLDGIKREVEASLMLNKKMLDDETFRTKFKSVVKEFTLGILHKNIHVKLCEDVDIFVNKLM